MPTLHDVARVAGVSIATVSATINHTAYVSPALQDRVRRAVRTTGYHPDGIARSLKTRTTQTLGLIISDITNPFFTALVRGIEDVAAEHAYTVVLCNTDERLEKEHGYVRLLRSRRVDGVIMAPAGRPADYAKFTDDLNVPVVFIDRRVPGVADAVLVDNARGAREAIEYLLQLGHRRIGLIAGLPHISTSRERLTGYTRALKAAGLRPDPALRKTGFSRLEGGYQAALDLLALPQPPSAIFATNNLMAIGLMRAIAEQGFECPRDISVVCFDDFEWAAVFRPRLTTVAQPTYDMGVKAAQRLFARFAGAATGGPADIVLAPSLIVRDSCAPPREGR